MQKLLTQLLCDTAYSLEPTFKTPEISVEMVAWVLVWHVLLVGSVTVLWVLVWHVLLFGSVTVLCGTSCWLAVRFH
jgi:hypothetical protein